jgi:hypothetical protein
MNDDLLPAQVLELDTQEEVAAARKKALIDRRRTQAAEMQQQRQAEAFGGGREEKAEQLAVEAGGGGFDDGGGNSRGGNSIYAGTEEGEKAPAEKWRKRCRRYHTQAGEYKQQGRISKPMVELQVQYMRHTQYYTHYCLLVLQMKGVDEPSYQELLDAYFYRCRGKTVLLKRQKEPGTYLQVMNGQFQGEEIKVIPAKFGPQLTKLGVRSRLYAPPPNEKDNMMYLVGKRQLPGAVVLLEFTEEDIAVLVHYTHTLYSCTIDTPS